MKKFLPFMLLIIVLVFIILPLTAYAALPPIVPECAKTATQEPPSLECMMIVFYNISKIIFGITGSLALLFFVYGGITWLTSGGSPEQIDKGRKILIGAVTGIIIIFGANLGVKLVGQAMGFKGREYGKAFGYECKDFDTETFLWSCQARGGNWQAKIQSDECRTGFCSGNQLCCKTIKRQSQ